MSEFQVESGIPRPTGYKRRASKYPFEKMQPGQSFFVPFGSDDARTVRRRLHSAAFNLGFRIKVREVDDDQRAYANDAGEPGVRVWVTGKRTP